MRNSDSSELVRLRGFTASARPTSPRAAGGVSRLPSRSQPPLGSIKPSFGERRLVGLTRFELVTPRLSSVCSNQLSYRPSSPVSFKEPDFAKASSGRPDFSFA